MLGLMACVGELLLFISNVVSPATLRCMPRQNTCSMEVKATFPPQLTILKRYCPLPLYAILSRCFCSLVLLFVVIWISFQKLSLCK